MAEHLNQKVDPPMSFFDRMGKPLGEEARSLAYEHCKAIGLSSAQAWECVQCMASQLERDEPYKAQREGMKYLDLTGTYRVMAALLSV